MAFPNAQKSISYLIELSRSLFELSLLVQIYPVLYMELFLVQHFMGNDQQYLALVYYQYAKLYTLLYKEKEAQEYLKKGFDCFPNEAIFDSIKFELFLQKPNSINTNNQ